MNIVVINGLHRSGTTLLSRLINALPGTFIIKDGIRMPWCYFRVETNDTFVYPRDCHRDPPLSLELNRKVRDIDQLKGILLEELKSLQLSPELHERWAQEIMQFKTGDTYKDVFGRLYADLSTTTGALYVGAKNTQMSQYAGAVLDAFPHLKWIEIIRDSRGWYCSSKVRRHRPNIFRSAHLWNKAVSSAMAQCGKRHLIITFEDLILSRGTTLQRICEFLEMDTKISEDWLVNIQLTENNGSPWISNSSYRKSGEQVFDRGPKTPEYRLLDPVPVDRWKTELALWQKLTLRMMTGENLKRLSMIRQRPAVAVHGLTLGMLSAWKEASRSYLESLSDVVDASAADQLTELGGRFDLQALTETVETLARASM